MSFEMRAAMMFAATIFSVLALLLAHSEEEEEPDSWKRK